MLEEQQLHQVNKVGSTHSPLKEPLLDPSDPKINNSARQGLALYCL